ncbi:NUDIX hydrolase [Polaribacter sp. R77954]|uniref:NUDIX hydrolase n=1 Tax=Polaribacter sp. R77954 TaxID=3093870 RepID=UPI0037C539A5
MYKVFVNDKPIIITSSSKNENKYAVYPFKKLLFEEILHKLKHDTLKGIVLNSTDLEKDWASFTQNLEVIPAAGGLVHNAKKEILFIYRNGVWDLPKGKIEKGESITTAAIREVEEECSIFNLKLGKKLLTTYHIYNQKGLKLKETHWFLMTSDYNKALSPQLEEGITEVCFKNEQETHIALQNTYANIKLVYDTYKEA